MGKKIVISDVDGCLTDGKFIYTADGKVAKVFGAHDNDGVKMLKAAGFEVVFITADKRGWDISKKRIDDMKCELHLVSEDERANWVRRKIKDYEWSCFFGDGITDINAGRIVDVFMAPNNARIETINAADYVTVSRGGEGAFLDLALKVIDINTDNE